MKSRLILLCTLLALSLSLFACTSKQASLEISCDEFMEGQHFTWEVEVNTGDSVTVTLCSNPTTGFQWTELAQISNETVLKQTDHKFVPPEAKGDKPPAPGSAGQEVWTFKALEKGTSTVSLEYSRPWEGGEKGEWTFVATMVVK